VLCLWTFYNYYAPFRSKKCNLQNHKIGQKIIFL
jgi:hypothetical protein